MAVKHYIISATLGLDESLITHSKGVTVTKMDMLAKKTMRGL